MPPKKNPLKLNKLQLRTLVLAQVLAKDPEGARLDEASGEATILHITRPHGEHVHVGGFTVSARDASGFSNNAVWIALNRKGLARIENGLVVLTVDGLAYDTGLTDHFVAPSDH